MSWIDTRQFQISDRNGRHYVFRRNNAGNTEINIPKNITTKAAAVRWLKAHPNKGKFKAKRKPARGAGAVKHPAFDPFSSNVGNVRLSPTNFFGYSSPKYTGLASPPTPATPRTNMTASNFKRSLRNVSTIGSGRQGKAYVARQGKVKFVLKIAPYDKLAKERGEPQPADVEYKIHRACQSVAPEGIVKVYSQLHTLDFVPSTNLKNVQNLNKPHFDLSKQNILVMELCDGGALDKWIANHKVSDGLMKRVASQVLSTLHNIGTKYPDFRHNDLHLENVFVSRKRGFLIADFGWARLRDKGTNPAVNTANGTSTASYYGVGPKTSSRYDMHLFLNSLREICLKHAATLPETIKFLNAVLPVGYRGKNDTHVNDFRLKYNDPCPDLPSLTKVLGHPYLNQKLVTSPNLVKARAKLRAIAPKKLVRPRSAELVAAKGRLRRVPVKKTAYTNAELVALERNRLFKLSPGTRARAVKLRAAYKPRGGNVKKGNAVNATARVKAKVIPTKKLRAIPKNVLNDPRFVKMWLKILGSEQGYNAENHARNVARNLIRNRLNKGQGPFSASPVATKKKSASPVKKSPGRVTAEANVRARRAIAGAKKSPETGRMKIKAPNSGRMVYANGGSVSLKYLKEFAKRQGVNIKGLRSKYDIVEKLFG